MAGAPIGARLADILALSRHGTQTLDLGGGLRAVAEYGQLRFDDGPSAPPLPAVLTVPGSVAYGSGQLTCEEADDGPLDADRLGPTLAVRPWQAGDRMRPLGLGGSRALQDLFTDRKVPRERRAAVPVVVAGDEIAWVPGVATGDRFAAGPATTRRVCPALALDCSSLLQDEHIGEILVQADELQHRIKEMAAEVSRDYRGRDLLLIGVLKGAVFFLADLMRELDVPCEVDFMAVSSYGSSTDSSGVVRILKDLDAPLEGRNVLIVEDIVDSGLTLQYLMRTLEARNPASIEVCALLTKPERRKVDMPARYVGFEIPDKFAIGYGLDYDERYRNLPYVATLTGIAD